MPKPRVRIRGRKMMATILRHYVAGVPLETLAARMGVTPIMVARALVRLANEQAERDPCGTCAVNRYLAWKVLSERAREQARVAGLARARLVGREIAKNREAHAIRAAARAARNGGRPNHMWTAAKRVDVCRQFLAGETLAAIGADFGIRGYTVSIVLQKHARYVSRRANDGIPGSDRYADWKALSVAARGQIRRSPAELERIRTALELPAWNP